VARLGAALKFLGVGSEDRVAVLALNSNRYLEYFYAVAWIGAASNPVNIRLAPPEIAYTLDNSASAVLFVDDTFAKMLPALRLLMKTVKRIVFMGDGVLPEGCRAYEDLIADHPFVPSRRHGQYDRRDHGGRNSRGSPLRFG